MNNPRLATRYAKSIIDLAVEKNKLEEVYNDMKYILGICKSNPDFVNLLKSPVIASEKKGKILTAVIGDKVSVLTASFLQLITRKNRESNLPEILKAFIGQYNELKQIDQIIVYGYADEEETTKAG